MAPNYIKGIDRIALVLATVTAIIAGATVFESTNRPILSTQYVAWRQSCEKRLMEVIDKRQFSDEEKLPFLRQAEEKQEKQRLRQKILGLGNEIVDVTDYFIINDLDGDEFINSQALEVRMAYEYDDELRQLRVKRPPKYLYRKPLMITLTVAGYSIGTFLIVLLGIGGTSRGVRRLLMWIVAGFRK